MNKEVVEKRRAILINVLYLAFIVAVFYVVLKGFLGILLPFIAAFLVAALIQRPVKFLHKKTHIGRGPVSAVFVLLLLGAVGLLLFLLGNRIFVRIRGFYDYVMLRMQNVPELFEDIKNWLISAIGFLPAAARESLTQSITDFFDNIIENGFEGFSLSGLGLNWGSLLSRGAGTIKDTVVQIPSVLIGVVISIVASVFMTIEYDEIIAFIVRQVPEHHREKLHTAKTVALTTLKKMLKAYSLIVLITTTELTIGMYLMKLLKIFDSDYIIFIAIIIAIIDIIPVLGTGTVLIPWSLYSFITGSIPLGVGLIVMYAIILVVRQVIEPKLVAGQVGVSPIVTIIAMYVGTKLFGVLGFFVLPFTVVIVNRLNEEGVIHLYKLKNHETDAPAAQPGGEGELTEAPAEPS